MLVYLYKVTLGGKFYSELVKKFNLKNMSFSFMIVLTVWASKEFFLNLFSEINGRHVLIASFIGYALKQIICTIFETIESEQMMPLNVDTYKGKLNSIFSKIFNIFLRDNGEGSSKTPNNNESSSIGYEDYEGSSDESSGEEVQQPLDKEVKQPSGDCAPKSDMDVFKEITNKASTE